MHNRFNKIIWTIFFFLLVGLASFIIYSETFSKNIITFEKRIYYLDDYIYIKLYSNDKNKANEALNHITSIYKKYHELTDRNNGYPGLKNLYYIHNNNEESEYLEIDSRLLDMLDLSLSKFEETNGLFDIRIGNLKDALENNNYELETIENKDVILNDGKIFNNNANIDLSLINKGYANKEVSKYLKSIGIDKYLINAGGHILLGEHYNNDKYVVALDRPTNNSSDIFIKLNLEKQAIVTKGSYDSNIIIDNKTYINAINPITKKLNNEFLSVTVIASDSIKADIWSNVLAVMNLEDALTLVNSLDDIEAMFYISDLEQIMSDGFNKYIY